MIKKYYLNIWIRNLILLGLLVGLVFLQMMQKFEPDETNILVRILFIIGIWFSWFFHNHVLLRKFFLKKLFVEYFSILIPYCVLLAFGYYGMNLVLNRENNHFWLQLLQTVPQTLFASAFYAIHLNIAKYFKSEETLALKAKEEIRYLKQQLDPHFLLNALNNLYGVSLSSPENVPYKIIELTDLLKYQIETSKKDAIGLNEELLFIDKYLDYTRWKSRNIAIESRSTGEQKNYSISPLIFLPLIENAIKYAVTNRNPKVIISWDFSENECTFVIINSCKSSETIEFSTKSGLENLKQRLSLCHPSSKLDIFQSSESFTAKLHLWKLATVA